MNFNSLHFLIFLPVVLLGYRLLPKKLRTIFLLAASYYFYMCWNTKLIFLILFTTLVSYLCAIFIEKYPKYKRLWLILTLLICLGALFYFKYYVFFYNSLLDVYNVFAQTDFSFEKTILLPVGISFYTFQTLSYVIDVYRGDYKAERNFIYYALFVSYFPQLVAGPIESAANLLPQLKAEHPITEEDTREGFHMLILGFFRKCVIADTCGIAVNQVYAHMDEANALAIAFTGILFCIEMYCDFAGYSEIAQGSARLMGVKLMRNFNRPYLSTSYGEFFRRWHISLNRWFTQYVYIPLGGNRGSKAKKIRNTVIVFALCGLWHGANWTYVLWGLYAALWVSIESIILKPMYAWAERKQIDVESDGVKAFRRFYMMIIFIPAALLFRANSLQQIGEIFVGLFGRWGFGFDYVNQAMQLMFGDLTSLLKVLGAVFATILVSRIDTDDSEGHRLPLLGYICMILTIAVSWVLLLETNANAAFAYFQF